jgi:hypothetical protein
MHVRQLCRGAQQLFPPPHLVTSERGLPEVVDHDRQAGVASGDGRDVVEMVWVHGGEFE